MKRIFKNLTFQVLTAVVIGILLGIIFPDAAKAMKPLGDIFINMVKMIIAPLIFFTIVLGIAGMGDMKKVGRVGGKALLYFEIVTTIALALGLIIANVVKPGSGVTLDPTQGQEQVAEYTKQGAEMGFFDFIIHIVPSNVVDAFAKGEILQVVFFAVLFGFALASLGKTGKPVLDLFDRIAKVFYKIVNMIMRVAPIGAFGAIAFTIGNYGLASLLPLGKLMLCVYATMFIFVFVILNIICKIFGFSLWKYLKHIKDELLIVLGTSSSESVLPRMMTKMEAFGCSKSVTSLVIPTGYSFNLDGTSVYLSMAVVFLAQVSGVDLSLTQEITILAVLMLTSKGAATVTGGGFIVLASTLSAMHVIPMAGLALLLGVDRFMSEARAIINMIGNGIATIVVAKSEKEFGVENNESVEQDEKSPAALRV
ncbi:aerobic C4-dicarboxylate transport protein [Scopulibacillus darangshiensis]|uniref:Aerobic C4-dicarboxylate transport protein n=1 Tax=Scopulibacillus darangshiensis TaxID=442528 RepID=A0A4R2NWP0_9BACL|nr:dicarboxylate/amino acid:cation symporter [Scopulibacillus darangshiensis]TCP26014.1 aerobic C4-dicarboxylate transport protein [Scopulibacillus darangshiensis]